VAVSIPISALQPVEKSWYQVGDTVDMIAGMLFVDNNLVVGADPIILNNNPVVQAVTPAVTGTPLTPQLVMQRIVQNAQVISVGEVLPKDGTPMPTPEGGQLNAITLAVTPEEAVVLQWALEAKLSLTLVHSTVMPSTYEPVMVARQFIPLGMRLKEDMLTIAYWPANMVTSGMYSDPASLVDQYANEPIEAWQPLTSSNVSDTGFWSAGGTPFGTVGLDILRTSLSGIPEKLESGDYVDLTVSFLVKGWPQDTQGHWPAINTTVPPDGYVTRKIVLKGLYVAQVDNDTVSIFWKYNDAFLYEQIVNADADHPIALTLTRTSAPDVDLHIENQPDGKIAVTIPLADLPKEFTYPGEVQILGQLTFIDNRPDPSAPDQLQTEPVTEIVVPNAQLIGYVPSLNADTGKNYTLIVSAEDLPTLRWFIEAGIPLSVAQ
jgi:hypothetical protein